MSYHLSFYKIKLIVNCLFKIDIVILIDLFLFEISETNQQIFLC